MDDKYKLLVVSVLELQTSDKLEGRKWVENCLNRFLVP
jgi:hypothetical protein